MIMGHSYGSVLGSRYAFDHPENLTAFIGIGQFVSFESSVRYEYEDALQKANEAGDDTGALTTAYQKYLETKTVQASSELSEIASRYHKAERAKNTILTGLVSPTFSTEDFLWYTKQLSYEDFMHYNGKLMDHLMTTDLRKDQPAYEVPVFFVSGNCDWNCAWKDALDYAQQIGAKMNLVEGCGHYVHVDDPVEFARIVKEDLASLGY